MGRADSTVSCLTVRSAATSAESCPALLTVRRIWYADARIRGAMLVVLVASIVARVLLAHSARPVLISDGRDYYRLAENLAAGRGYVQVYDGESLAPFNGFPLRAFRSPGYPALMAGLYSIFGWRPGVYLGTNLAADLVTEGCALLIAAYLFGAGAALVAQVLVAAHVLWMPNPMTESVYAALFALIALMLVMGLPFRNWAAALAFGLVVAAALFVRPITVCIVPALLLAAWKHVRRNARVLVLVGLALAPSVAATLCWAWRNYRVLGDPVLFTTSFGHHNAPDYGIAGDQVFTQLRAEGLNEAQINRELIRMEMSIAARHPFAFFMTWLTRAASLFSLKPPWEVRDLLWTRIFPLTPPSLVATAYRWSCNQYCITYALAACGVVVLAWKRRLGGLGTLACLYVAIHALLSRGDLRLAAPLYPLMCVVIGGLAAVIGQHLKKQPHATAGS
jgi:hypothetical protein